MHHTMERHASASRVFFCRLETELLGSVHRLSVSPFGRPGTWWRYHGIVSASPLLDWLALTTVVIVAVVGR